MKLFYTQVRRLVLLSGIILFCSNSFGQISIVALPYVPATTNFNAYNPTSLANLNATIGTGWTAVTTGTAVYNGQGNGTGAAAGYWALGTGGEYCLGSVPSGASDNITYTVSFVNNSGSTITSLAISWDYEQWRFSSGNNSTLNCTGTGSLAANGTVNGSDYASVVGTDGTVSSTNISIVLTGLSITNGTAFGLQWVAANAGSAAADKGIGIDNFNIVASRTDPTDHFRTKQTGNWSAVSTWQSSVDAITWVNSNLAPDFNANTITVRNAHLVTVTTSVSVDQTSINTGGQVTVNGGQTLTIPDGLGTDLTVDGTIINSGIISQTGTIAFNAASLYTHGINGGTIPTATWNATSTCNITGVTNTAPGNLNQAFGNFTWNCPSHATDIYLNSALSNIQGNFTVTFAGNGAGASGKGSRPLILSTNIDLTLNVGGSIIMDHASNEATWLVLTAGTANVIVNVAGNFNMSKTGIGACYFDYKVGTGTTMGTIVMNVTGNLTMTGGYFDMAFQASSYSVATELRLTGNLSVSASSTFTSSGSSLINGKVIFNKTGTQTIFEGAAGVLQLVNYQVNSGSTLEMLSNFYLWDFYGTAIKGGNLVVLSGGILDAATFQIPSSTGTTVATFNSFTLSSGAGIITSNPFGVHQIGFVGPTISAAIGTRVFSSGANYTYDGTATQVSGTFVTTPVANQVNNLTISNTAGKFTTGVSLQQAIAVAGVCTFNVGALTTTSVLLLTINDNATAVGANNNALPSFANGPVKKIGNDAFTFPVGKVTVSYAAYRYCIISAPALTTDAFTGEFMRAPATLLGPITDPLIYAVSYCEYWKIDRTTGASNVDITLTWSSLYSSCNAITYVSDFTQIAIAHFNGASWNSHGGAYNLGSTNSDGTVTWAGVSVFSPFSLTTLSPFTNPLPIKLTSINAYKIQGGNKVEWSNLTEQGVNIYELEKSADGRTFDVVNAQQAKKNNGSKADYNWIDVNPFSSITYYRIRAIERTGNVLYSPVVKVQTGGNIKDGFIVYPNPVIAKQFTVQLSSPVGLYKIKLINNFGQEIMSTQWQHLGGSASKTIELNPSVSAGIYHLQITGGNQIMQTKILIQ